MVTLELKSGRLLEVRVEWPVAMDDVQAFVAKVKQTLVERTGNVVAIVDVRKADVFPKPVADAFIAIMKHDNPRMERSAYLVSEKAILAMQIDRMIREGGSAQRRTFRETPQAEAWLGELLTPEEKARLATFVREGS